MAKLDLARRLAGADPEDDVILEACLDAAAQWYQNAGVDVRYGDKLYDFWVANLAAWMYDNRGNADMNAGIPLYIIASVHQLRPASLGGGGCGCP